MADYCSLSEALALIPNVGTLRNAVAYSAGPPIVPAVVATVPSLAQAAILLAQTTAEIDRRLRGQGAATPAVDPEALEALNPICANGAAAKIAKAKWPSGSGPGGDGGVVASLREDYKDGLLDIDKGRLGIDLEGSGTSIAFDFDDYSDVPTTTWKQTSSEAPF